MADFLAGYVSGAIGILVGNPLDVLKTRLQASSSSPGASGSTPQAGLETHASRISIRLSHRDALRGLAAPVLTYGALNAVLFATYNRTLSMMSTAGVSSGARVPDIGAAPHHPYWAHFAAGCLAGMATFVISAPTEVVKCRAQVVRERVSLVNASNAGHHTAQTTSWTIAKDMWRTQGVRGFYHGGAITAVRDSVGYGFYYLAYEATKDVWDSHSRSPGQQDGGCENTAAKVLVCGGLAGVVTWASIFPLDVIKTRVQTQDLKPMGRALGAGETAGLLSGQSTVRPLGALMIARQAYRAEGMQVFFRGIGVCCARAFVVNAMQWGVYEWVMLAMRAQPLGRD
jgi:solute carrier family 25 carnitine/acylcarnitine transporter 20/29